MRISYVGPYLSSAPGSAALQRALGLSQSLVAAGATVRIGTGDALAAEPNVPSVYPAGITVERVSRRVSGPGALRKALSWWSFADDVIRWLEEQEERPDGVILYGGGQHFARRIDDWSRSRGIATIVDVVEWYDPKHQPLGSLGPFARDLEKAMLDAYPRTGNIIAISEFLNQHFTDLGCRTIVIPPTTNVSEIAPSYVSREGLPLRFVYAGNPGQKDLLGSIVNGLEMVSSSGRSVQLDVAGPDTAATLQLLSRAKLPGWIQCHGKLLRRDVLDLIGNTHYVPLLRPDARYAHAGFPTKVVESFSVGTPVISNLTSDLGRHVQDQRTGFTAVDASPSSFADAVGRAFELSAIQYQNMRLECRRHAESLFDFRTYSEDLGLFMKEALAK